MISKRKHLGVAVLDNLIYAVGGRDENTELNTVERYVYDLFYVCTCRYIHTGIQVNGLYLHFSIVYSTCV